MAGDNYSPALSSIFDGAFERHLRFTPLLAERTWFCDIRLFGGDTGEPWRFLLPVRWAFVSADGLLVRAGELCGIVRASYLSPFFPFVLGFELWRYLRRQLPGDRFVRARNSRLSLRLLRGGAFAVTLMLPAEGWAHGDGALAGRFCRMLRLPNKETPLLNSKERRTATARSFRKRR